MDSLMRPETKDAKSGTYSPANGTAYLMVYNAVKSKERLISGKLHAGGESCAIGSFFDANPKCALSYKLIDEIAAVNDSFVDVTPRQRRILMLRWLRWKLSMLGMEGFKKAKLK